MGRRSFGVILVLIFILVMYIGISSVDSKLTVVDVKEIEKVDGLKVTYEEAGCNIIKYLFLNGATKETIDYTPANRDGVKKLVIFTEVQLTSKEREHDIDLMAHLICSELGILGRQAMYNCGSVALNRKASSLFPNTLEGVIYEKGQYEVTWNGQFETQPTQEAYEIATDLIDNGSVLPANILFQAQFKQGDFVHCKIGNTYFCGVNLEDK